MRRRSCLGALGAFLFLVGGCESRKEKAPGSEARPRPVRATPLPHAPGAVPIRDPSVLTPSEVEQANQAWDAFLSLCGGASMLPWDQFQSFSIDVGPATGYLRMDYDWAKMATVAIVFKDGLSRERSGQHVEYRLGAGQRPGMVTSKAAAIDLCGFQQIATGVRSGQRCQPSGGEDCIVDDPRLRFLDRDRPTGLTVSDRTAPPAWCFARGFDPPAFWTCALNEKQCKRMRLAAKRDENGDFLVRTDCKKAEATHCFDADGKSVCAPDSASCIRSRKEWEVNNKVTDCEVASADAISASLAD
jgi:hypothetical protein